MRKLGWSFALLALLVTPAFAARVTTWTVPGDFATIKDAIESASVAEGDRILVGAGAHDGALVTKRVMIEGRRGAVITGGPAHSSGHSQGFRFLAGSDGSEVRSLVFAVDLAIMNGARVGGVTVAGNTFRNALQAVSNWGGSDWIIVKNTIEDLQTDCGGGIGILVADRSGGAVSGNLVRQNVIEGTLHVHPLDCGGYNGTGIVLYADFRWGSLGASAITGNRILSNKVSLDVDDPRVSGVGDPLDVVAIELTDTRDDSSLGPVLFGNSVGFNDLRGTALQIDLTPGDLDQDNYISRNLGDNRGHGLQPTLLLKALD